MKALIDGDIVLHRCGYASDNDPLQIALVRTNVMMEEILAETKADSYEVWLSDSYENNFRKQLAPSYKANRVQPRPVHYEAIKDFLYEHWNANLALGMEADDAMGIEQTAQRDTIICSIDKDLLQIPGRHYNFVRKEFYEISPIEGCRQLYRQLLIGDTSDNIRGVDGIGKVKAGRLIDPLNDEVQMFGEVRRLYADDERLLTNGRLLYIRRVDNEVWTFPKSTQQEAETKQSSTALTETPPTSSSEHTTADSGGSPAVGWVTDGTKTQDSQGLTS